MMLQVGDKIKITQADDDPRYYIMLGKAFYSEFNGTEFLGCERNGSLGVMRWPMYLLLKRLIEPVYQLRKRNNIDCMLEQIFAENLA